MAQAWRLRRRLGGGMRQAGLLAAAGLYGLRRNFERLAEDHARARRLAEAVNAIAGLSAPAPETNLVMIHLEDPGLADEDVLSGLLERGVRVSHFGARRLRAVTHLDVGEADVEAAASALREVVENAGT